MVLIGWTALRQQDFYSGLKVEQENQTLKRRTENGKSVERTSEQSNPSRPVFFFFFLEVWGGLMRSSVWCSLKGERSEGIKRIRIKYFTTKRIRKMELFETTLFKGKTQPVNKYKTCCGSLIKGMNKLRDIYKSFPNLFVHWQYGYHP